MGDFMSSVYDETVSSDSIRTKGFEIMGLAEGLDNLIESYSNQSRKDKAKPSVSVEQVEAE